jgi:hypothetical protein
MRKFIKKNYLFVLNIAVILFLILLPYVLFKGKFYISGDDTRLYYIYPFEYLKEFTFSSWHHFSSVGANGPTQFMMPFLVFWSFMDLLIPSKVALSYLGFTMPIALGFIFLQIFIREILPKKIIGIEPFLASIFFIFSPIVISNQYFIFLSTIWLLPLIPLGSYLFLKFVKTGDKIFLALAVVSCFMFSMGLFSIPWIIGYILPLFVGYTLVSFAFRIKPGIIFIKRSLAYLGAVIASQIFWFFPFVMTYIGGSDVNFGSKVFSKEVTDTFTPTVLATATGNIIYPLLNLFHRQIAFDSNWQLKHVFMNFYDKTILLDLIFIIILFSGILLFKKHLLKRDRVTYILILIAFVFALFLFTVNIGPLKEVFLILGKLPGFVMFRNFYDKLALGFAFFYSILIAYSFNLVGIKKRKFFGILTSIFVFVVLINLTQIGSVVNAPLWLTRDIGRNIMIPAEYTDFMKSIPTRVSSTSNIFTVPFGTALYSVIKDTDSDNVYTGTSPVKLFSGINDYSGFLSFYFSEANSIIEKMIVNKDYAGLSEILYTYNVNYAFWNSNIPTDVLNTWVFDKRMNRSLDENFKKAFFVDKPLIVSEKGNYALYEFKRINTILKSKNLTYKKINETKFKLKGKRLWTIKIL